MQSVDMGRLRTLAQTFHNFVTDHVEALDVPAVADGNDGDDTSTKIALLLLKEEINKPLPQLEDHRETVTRCGYRSAEQISFQAATK